MGWFQGYYYGVSRCLDIEVDEYMFVVDQGFGYHGRVDRHNRKRSYVTSLAPSPQAGCLGANTHGLRLFAVPEAILELDHHLSIV